MTSSFDKETALPKLRTGGQAPRQNGFDPEGNVSKTYGTAMRSLAAMVAGIAGALKMSSIISAIAKVVAAAASAGS